MPAQQLAASSWACALLPVNSACRRGRGRLLDCKPVRPASGPGEQVLSVEPSCTYNISGCGGDGSGGHAPHSPRLSQTWVPLQLGPDVAVAGTAGGSGVNASPEPVQSRSWFCRGIHAVKRLKAGTLLSSCACSWLGRCPRMHALPCVLLHPGLLWLRHGPSRGHYVFSRGLHTTSLHTRPSRGGREAGAYALERHEGHRRCIAGDHVQVLLPVGQVPAARTPLPPLSPAARMTLASDQPSFTESMTGLKLHCRQRVRPRCLPQHVCQEPVHW